MVFGSLLYYSIFRAPQIHLKNFRHLTFHTPPKKKHYVYPMTISFSMFFFMSFSINDTSLGPSTLNPKT